MKNQSPLDTGLPTINRNPIHVGCLLSMNNFSNLIVEQLRNLHNVKIQDHKKIPSQDHTLDLILCDKANLAVIRETRTSAVQPLPLYLLIEENDSVPARYLSDDSITNILVVSQQSEHWGVQLEEKIAHLSNNRNNNGSNSSISSASTNDFLKALNKAIATAAPMNTLSIPELSQMLGVSSKTFCKKIKRYTGICAVQYILQQRLIMASHLLQERQVSVQEAAIKTGFMSDSYFTKVFKKMFGTVPSSYTTTVYTP